MAPQLTASEIASHLALPPNGHASQTTQVQHRLNLISSWTSLDATFSEASRILEVGCGQGDQTAALASIPTVKSITAIDPGPPGYGSPFTLAEAQETLQSSPLGDLSSITFARAAAPDFLAASSTTTTAADQDSPRFDAAVLSHCLWYFSDQTSIVQTLTALKAAQIPRLYIAEWGLQISNLDALPHLLAVLVQSYGGGDEEANVRTPVGPAELRELAVRAGWRLVGEEVLESPGVRDGEWEVYAAMGAVGDAADGAEGSKARREALEVAVEKCGGKKKVRCMDVWSAVFE